MRSQLVLAGRFEVFEDGRINRIENGVSSPAAQYLAGRSRKYAQVSFTTSAGKQKNAYVHRLVATAFIPNPDNLPQVNHKDGDTSNNAASNLEWVTPSENIRHAYKTGLLNRMACAEQCGLCGAPTLSSTGFCPACQSVMRTSATRQRSKALRHDRYCLIDTTSLSPTQAAYVESCSAGFSHAETARKYGVSKQAVQQVVSAAESKHRKQL